MDGREFTKARPPPRGWERRAGRLLLGPEAAGSQEPSQPIEIMRHENRVKSERKRWALAEGLAPG